jgi:hypothetical protein
MTNIVAVFSTLSEAERALIDVRAQGIPKESVHLIAGNDKSQHDEYLDRAKEESTGGGTAAWNGASLGGGVGIVAGLVALAIPGVGPIIAAGPLATVLTGLGIGAAGGGLVGIFRNMGMSHEEAPLYEEAVRRGSILAVVQTDEERAGEIRKLMELHGARDVRNEADTWRQQGWSGPSADPHPFTSDDGIVSNEMTEEVKPESAKTSGSGA